MTECVLIDLFRHGQWRHGTDDANIRAEALQAFSPQNCFKCVLIENITTNFCSILSMPTCSVCIQLNSLFGCCTHIRHSLHSEEKEMGPDCIQVPNLYFVWTIIQCMCLNSLSLALISRLLLYIFILSLFLLISFIFPPVHMIWDTSFGTGVRWLSG